MAPVLPLLRFERARVLTEVDAQDLLHIGQKVTVPGHSKHGSTRRNVFVHDGSIRRPNLMNFVVIVCGHGDTGVHMGAIRLDRGGAAAQRSLSGETERQKAHKGKEHAKTNPVQLSSYSHNLVPVNP